MTPAPQSFGVQLGFTMDGVTGAARRIEMRHEFKVHAIAELEERFASERWAELIADPFSNGLTYDAETGSIDDAELRNWINGSLDECGTSLQVGELEDSSCHFDRFGCWWKVRSYPLEEGGDDGARSRYTSKEAARRYVEGTSSERDVPPATRDELSSMGYRLTVTWKNCPEPADEPGSSLDDA